MSWGAITFTPTASQLESLRALKGMSSIRIQGSRSHATFDRVNKSIADAKNLGVHGVKKVQSGLSPEPQFSVQGEL